MSYVVMCMVYTFAEPGPDNGWVVRARPPAAFVRIRACWYASAAISETNFCAASDTRRFLNVGYCLFHLAQNPIKDLQTYILTLEPNPLKVIVCNFIRDLLLGLIEVNPLWI